MTIAEIEALLPSLAEVLDHGWLQSNAKWAEQFIPPRLGWFEQLEADLGILKGHVGIPKLAQCYRKSLRNEPEIQMTMYEVRGAAVLATAGTLVDLHVPRDAASVANFDVLVQIKGHEIRAESKTRKDQFPFNFPGKQDASSGLTFHEGGRATLDPHDATTYGADQGFHIPGVPFKDIPESTVIRQILLEALEQLPPRGLNMILFGQIEGLQLNVEDALYGSEYVEVIRDPKIGRAMPKQRRYPTGAFFPGEAGEPFRDLAAVLWMEIQGADAKERNYRLYVNNNAREKLPAVVKAALNEVLHENSLRPCDDSDDDLTPEARRLLGLE